MSEQPGTDDPADTAPEAGAVVVTRHRGHHFPTRGRRITVRLEYTELAAIELAAGRAGTQRSTSPRLGVFRCLNVADQIVERFGAGADDQTGDKHIQRWGRSGRTRPHDGGQQPDAEHGAGQAPQTTGQPPGHHRGVPLRLRVDL